jgi:hypothetical protein
MMRGSDPSERTERERGRRARLDPLALGDAFRKLASAPRGASVVSRDDASPEAVHDLLTEAQLAVRWQLSRGTLANQRSQGRGPAYLKWPAGSDTGAQISKPTRKRDSCRGSQRDLRPSANRVTCGKRSTASFDLLVPDTEGLLARGLEDPCQVALVTLEVTAEVHAGGHAHIGVP